MGIDDQNHSSKQKREGYEVDHLPRVETKKTGIARVLHDLFMGKVLLCPADAQRLLKDMGRKTSYVAVQRLFKGELKVQR